jgi:hypothetical protein
MSEKTTMDVIVHKAINLRTGETLGQFTQELSTAGRAHVFKKLNMSEQNGGSWMVEVFSKSVVFTAYKRTDPPSKDKYFAFTFDRTEKGTFEFGDMVEVERVTSFKAKEVGVNKMTAIESITKRMDTPVAKRVFQDAGDADAWVETG